MPLRSSPPAAVSCFLAGAVAVLLLGGCLHLGPTDRPVSRPAPGTLLRRTGDEIMVCGQLVHTGTRVVLWNDPEGYDAYRSHRHFTPEVEGPEQEPQRLNRFGWIRKHLAPELHDRVRAAGWRLADLQDAVSQVVVHYDACGSSRRCFEVLHDLRGLSCHFLLDVDGTIYQTLDLKERAWHAAEANDRSVGIEIANIGAYALDGDGEEAEVLSAWYAEDEEGIRFSPPADVETGLPPDFVGRPARQQLFRGVINGKHLLQYDFTEEQYVALEKLLVTLCRVFPKVEPRFPLEPGGGLRTEPFPTPEALHEFAGILGHHHIHARKVDPGPAFDWERIAAALKRAGVVRHGAGRRAAGLHGRPSASGSSKTYAVPPRSSQTTVNSSRR